MSLNSYLLSKLTTNLNKGADVYSLLRRYQELWIIYTNLLSLFGLIIWKVINVFIYPSTGDLAMLATFPWLIVSFALLKKNKNDLAAGVALFGFHIGNFVSGNYSSLAASHFGSLIPGLGFLLSHATYVHVLNLSCCFLQNIRHMYALEQKFKVTFTEEQRFEIVQLYLVSFMTLMAITGLFYLQNLTKTNLWQLAQSNYLKTEEIAKELVQEAKAKDTFVSSLSHEIRNPLNCMNGSIDYLLQVTKDPSHLQLLNNAKTSGEVLLNLLTNVLDAAKLKSEKMELSYTKSNPKEIIRKLLILYSERLREKHIAVDIYMDKYLPNMVWIDPSRLLQIMINLFSNALKFTQQNGKIKLYLMWSEICKNKENLLTLIDNSQHIVKAEKTISTLSHENIDPNNEDIFDNLEVYADELLHSEDISSRLKKFNFDVTPVRTSEKFFLETERQDERFVIFNLDGRITAEDLEKLCSPCSTNISSDKTRKRCLKIQISDTGCGINQENIPKLFEMFSQANNAIGSIQGGSGLGLWICKQLCIKMGGEIKLYSAVNKGTTFVFYLPINNDHFSLFSQPQTKRGHDQMKALVVDDFSYNRDVHKLILERENIQVNLACDGKQALEVYTAHEEGYFQFIMMDIMMPVMDGFTAAKKIREWESEKKRKKVDIYFISGEYYDENDVLRELRKEGGMIDIEGIKCLKKPIDVEQIRKLLKDVYTANDQ